ncbi:MAG: catalase [Oscillospiraceae bacterium]|nr:catalase [Oscillospiraceae bacterium]
MKAWQHFKTITRHRNLVMLGCLRVGLVWQGLTHDLSKYSPTEFCIGVKYYQGTRSPNAAEREENGYSQAWMHHKGRNRHHYEYWTDMSRASGQYEAVPMPRKYLVEMVMDRRAACIVYQGERYTDGSALEYFDKSREKSLMHEQTKRELRYLLTMLKEQGEEATFRYMKQSVLKGKPFPWEEE